MDNGQYDRTISAALGFAPPGHFYSPHPKLEDVEASFEKNLELYKNAPGIDLNIEQQLAMFRNACTENPVGPWAAEKSNKHRYHYDNWFFRFGDANAVWHMARHFRPKRIIEIGSGYSTACWLDAIDQLELDTKVTCVEPYPERVYELCSQSDIEGRIRLERSPVQEIPLDIFGMLDAGDILFIDSTYVSKSGSDVNYLFFQVLPRLRLGVIVHIHDIFWPFEYPREWYLEGRAWNECFVIRAFLQFNSAFRILRFNSYLSLTHTEVLQSVDERFVSDAGGSLWLEKTI